MKKNKNNIYTFQLGDIVSFYRGYNIPGDNIGIIIKINEEVIGREKIGTDKHYHEATIPVYYVKCVKIDARITHSWWESGIVSLMEYQIEAKINK